MSIQPVLLNQGVPSHSIVNFDTVTGEYTDSDNQPLEPVFNLITGVLEFKDKFGIVLFSFTLTSGAKGGSAQVATIATVSFSDINALGAVPTANLTFPAKIPADFFIQGLIAVVTTGFATVTPNVFFNVTPGIFNFAVLEFASNFINGKAFTTTGALAKTNADLLGGQAKNAVALDLTLKNDFVNGLGAPSVNPINYTAGSITFYAVGASFGTSTGYAQV